MSLGTKLKPMCIGMNNSFKLGKNKWDQKLGQYTLQEGFQCFELKKDAVDLEKSTTLSGQIVIPVIVKAEHIKKITDDHPYYSTRGYVYETQQFYMLSILWIIKAIYKTIADKIHYNW
jgi:hypothetical protein